MGTESGVSGMRLHSFIYLHCRRRRCVRGGTSEEAAGFPTGHSLRISSCRTSPDAWAKELREFICFCIFDVALQVATGEMEPMLGQQCTQHVSTEAHVFRIALSCARETRLRTGARDAAYSALEFQVRVGSLCFCQA